MYCSNCGSKVDKNDNFCTNCGNDLNKINNNNSDEVRTSIFSRFSKFFDQNKADLVEEEDSYQYDFTKETYQDLLDESKSIKKASHDSSDQISSDQSDEENFENLTNPHGSVSIDPDKDYIYEDLNQDLVVEEDNFFYDVPESLKVFFKVQNNPSDDLDKDIESKEEIIEDRKNSDLEEDTIEEIKDLDSKEGTVEDIEIDKSSDEKDPIDLEKTLVFTRDELKDNLSSDTQVFSKKDLDQELKKEVGESKVEDEKKSSKILYESYDNYDESPDSSGYSYKKSTVLNDNGEEYIISETKTQVLEDDKPKEGELKKTLENLGRSGYEALSKTKSKSSEVFSSIKAFFTMAEDETNSSKKSNVDIVAPSPTNTSDTAPLIFTKEEQDILNQAIIEQNRSSRPKKLLEKLNKKLAPIIRNLLNRGGATRILLFIAAFGLCAISVFSLVRHPGMLIGLSGFKFLSSYITIYLATKYAFNALRIRLSNSLMNFFIILQLLVYHLIDTIYILFTVGPSLNVESIIHIFTPNLASMIGLAIVGLLLLGANYQKIQQKGQAIIFFGWYIVVGLSASILLAMFEILILTTLSPIIISLVQG